MRCLTVSLAVSVLAACGGQVVVDDSSEAATGASSSAASVGASSSSGSGADCASLEEDFVAKLTAAVACSPTLPDGQCVCMGTVPEPCGCPVMVNQTQPGLIQAAQAAREAWLAAGCTKSPCPGGCPASCPGLAKPLCESTPDGAGFCTSQMP